MGQRPCRLRRAVRRRTERLSPTPPSRAPSAPAPDPHQPPTPPGEPAWNVDPRIQGHLDIPLNDPGLWQAEQLARALAGEPIAAIYTSDLQRAHATAQAVARTTGAPLTAEPGLRERSFGRFQGRTFAQIEAELPADALRWRKR